MMNLDGKTKDSLNARRDLEEMGIRRDLHPTESNGKIVLPLACYSMSKDEKKNLCQWYLRKLKRYVHNKTRAKGSIAEQYLVDECLTFCSRYLHNTETKFNRTERNYDGVQPSTDTSQLSIFSMLGKPFGKAEVKELSVKYHDIATFYVLQNCEESQPFVREHKNILMNAGIHNITQLYKEGQVCKHMLSLARGPEKRATYYPGYSVNGFRFHTMNRDETRKTQNNGVVVKGENETEEVPYYGRIRDIVELCYTKGNKVVLFDCDWFDTSREGRGYKRDRYGIVTVNIKRKLNTQDTFVLACQANQAYYTEGMLDNTWSAVNEIKSRNLYEMPVDGEPYQEETQFNGTNVNQEGNENEEVEID
ncbi:hypothetical protein Q3G72_025660 [Acer saccharum]|nr:hypothetical protein Q3G72_025660 [Acer saccharum]